jgi:ribonuclease MRP protein subunit RMP1
MPSPQEELHSIAQILHLTHHRNKNQHRLVKWYKAFNLLRRHISKLSSELETNITYSALSAKAKKTIESREIVEARVTFLEDVLIEKCYLAFSRLVADNQYAALGLMLLGILARVKRVIEPLRGERDEVMEEVRNEEGLKGDEVLDFGEVIQREEILDLGRVNEDRPAEEDEENDAASSNSKKKKRSMTTEEAIAPVAEDSNIIKQLKKKRKKGDAFDDLFAGLV